MTRIPALPPQPYVLAKPAAIDNHAGAKATPSDFPALLKAHNQPPRSPSGPAGAPVESPRQADVEVMLQAMLAGRKITAYVASKSGRTLPGTSTPDGDGADEADDHTDRDADLGIDPAANVWRSNACIAAYSLGIPFECTVPFSPTALAQSASAFTWVSTEATHPPRARLTRQRKPAPVDGRRQEGLDIGDDA